MFIEYFVGIYFNIYAYGLWLFLALAAITVGGGLILLFAMADNGEKGTLDFSLSYMEQRSVEYASVIGMWKKAAGIFVMVALLAIFAPSKEVVSQLIDKPTACVNGK